MCIEKESYVINAVPFLGGMYYEIFFKLVYMKEVKMSGKKVIL